MEGTEQVNEVFFLLDCLLFSWNVCLSLLVCLFFLVCLLVCLFLCFGLVFCLTSWILLIPFVFTSGLNYGRSIVL